MPVRKQIDGNTRSIVGEFEFDETPEQVWNAITNPDEIAKWFSLRARVEGKVGGAIQFDWKPLFDFEWIDRITVWEPNKRLAFAPTAETVAREGLDYICDFVITTAGGKTKLTMVHSGFTTEAKWDEEFESYFGGWNYELFSLEHYVKNHLGENRRILWVSLNYAEHNIENPYNRIADSKEIFTEKSIREFKPGDRYRMNLCPNEHVEGIVMQLEPGGHDQFAGTIDNMNNGLFRIGAGKRFCFAWLALYNQTDERAAHLEKLFQEKFKNSLTLPA